MKKNFLCCCMLLLLLLSSATLSLHAQQKQVVSSTTKGATGSYTYQIINVVNGTFGYDIYNKGKLLIHQPAIPALDGNEGFKTKTGADKVAQLVIMKIKNGEMPPTVSIEEMKALKAI